MLKIFLNEYKEDIKDNWEEEYKEMNSFNAANIYEGFYRKWHGVYQEFTGQLGMKCEDYQVFIDKVLEVIEKNSISG